MAFKQQWLKTVPGVVVTAVAVLAMLALGNVAWADVVVVRGIQHEYDDAEEYLNTLYTTASYAQGAGWLDSSDLELGSEGGGGQAWQVIAMQYDQLGIPQGATITSAKITFTIDNSGNPGTSNDFTILGEDADNAAPYGWGYHSPRWPTSEALDPFDITSRARTSAGVPWAPAAAPSVGSTLDTPDISTVIQEIVDRDGWSADNRLTLMIYPDVYLASPPPPLGTTTVQEIEFEADPAGDSNSAHLTVHWIPEPSTLVLLGMGALGLVLFGRRKRA